jgi:hypothetical protein
MRLKESRALNRREMSMSKTFITERDIEDMARQGRTELSLDDSTVLTDLAYEKAGRLGVKLLQTNSQPPASPIRPYLSPPPAGQAAPSSTAMDSGRPVEKPCGACIRPDTPNSGELKRRVIEAVTARLGNQVDGALLATIVDRVFVDLGV